MHRSKDLFQLRQCKAHCKREGSAFTERQNAVYLSETITLSKGENKISTVAYKDGKEYKDNTVWYYVPLKQTIPGAE